MFTKIFKDIYRDDIGIAGGKGASLGEMTHAKMAVPPGFVVLANAFDRFLEETDLGVEIKAAFKEINYSNLNSVEKGSGKIRDLIYDAKFPKDIAVEVMASFKELKEPLVAVRSSATVEDSTIASWAGELESYLNVTSKNLLESVKECWASLYTPRAIVYGFEKKLPKQKVSVAVVVQKMVHSEVAGITFTVHPVTQDRHQMVIEAGYGLGQAIVGGEITPDTYVIDKKKKAIIDRNISDQSMMMIRGTGGIKRINIPKPKQGKQKLKDSQILKLAGMCLKIEDHYDKTPQDIEWAFEKGKFYIVQSRPITTLL